MNEIIQKCLILFVLVRLKKVVNESYKSQIFHGLSQICNQIFKLYLIDINVFKILLIPPDFRFENTIGRSQNSIGK